MIQSLWVNCRYHLMYEPNVCCPKVHVLKLISAPISNFYSQWMTRNSLVKWPGFAYFLTFLAINGLTKFFITFDRLHRFCQMIAYFKGHRTSVHPTNNLSLIICGKTNFKEVCINKFQLHASTPSWLVKSLSVKQIWLRPMQIKLQVDTQ
jgi:hypothetical protein